MMDMTDPHETADLLERQDSRLLSQVAVLVGRQVGAALEARGATKHDFAVLATLDQYGPDSQANLARRTRIDRSDMVAALSGLEAAGAVVRDVDATDRRRNVVALSAAGRARLAELAAALEVAQAQAMAPLDAAERDVLRGLLRKLRG
ncbi:DNA-binding transcriptional regulator, MarR family [Devosia limi DSM 17137]|uniref:DNA-binding transcriptional regulator, MarR family n=3 Tax=Devosia TaxID=46913 RepID=A0A1M4WUY6_9HYPH|nr:DNA-binding transcriptional regulator, MarR family [Devosia limi DSM 17137]